MLQRSKTWDDSSIKWKAYFYEQENIQCPTTAYVILTTWGRWRNGRVKGAIMLNFIEMTIMANVYVTYLIPFNVETVISSLGWTTVSADLWKWTMWRRRKMQTTAYAYTYICKYACIYLRIVVRRLAHLPSRWEGGVCIGLVPRRVCKAKLITPSSDVTGLRPILSKREREREKERVQSALHPIRFYQILLRIYSCRKTAGLRLLSRECLD